MAASARANRQAPKRAARRLCASAQPSTSRYSAATWHATWPSWSPFRDSSGKRTSSLACKILGGSSTSSRAIRSKRWCTWASAWGCGAEVLGPRWEDVDYDNRIITVRTRVNRLGKGVGLIVSEGLKSQPERRIAMPRLVTHVLRKRWPRQLESRLHAGKTWHGPDYADNKPTGFIFTGATGMVLQPRRADLYFGSVRVKPGSGAHRFHGLRHDFASLLLAARIADRVVMEMMGHSDYSITANRYQHVPDELQYLAADRLDAMLSAMSQ
jgi:integrase